MALSASTCAAAVAGAVGGLSEPQKQNLTQVWTTILTEIFNHIKTQGQVNPGIPVATTGSPTAQTGATTAPGVIS